MSHYPTKAVDVMVIHVTCTTYTNSKQEGGFLVPVGGGGWGVEAKLEAAFEGGLWAPVALRLPGPTEVVETSPQTVV